ncbi:SCO2400 family protein [Streptomyces spinosirectus]
MDYCSSCRRHLNGALVCPGCGAYAPDIAPVNHQGGGFDAFAAKRPSRPEPHPFEPFEESPAAEAALPSGDGRAARRRQRARWRKSRRKAVLATTVALVGGGLALSTMEQGSGHKAEAATAPDLTSTGNQDLPAQQYAEPTVTQPGTGKHRKPSATDDRSAAGARQHSTATPDAPHTASERTQPYSAPHTAATTQPGTTTHTATGSASGTSGSSSGSGSTTPAPSATTGSGSSTSGSSSTGSSSAGSSSSGTSGSNSSGSNASQPSTAPAATSPSSVCVLGLLCLS